MHARSLAAMAGLAALGFCVAPVAAQDASRTFEQRFGQELDRVADTPDRDDDLELADEMVTASGSVVKTNPALTRLLCEKAAELAERHPGGHAVRIKALRRLARVSPRDRVDILSTAASLAQQRYRLAGESRQQPLGERLVALLTELAAAHEEDGERQVARLFYEQALETANEIGSERKGKVQAALHQLDIISRIEALQARLEADPTDHEAADKLMRLYVVERDAPAKADEFYFSADDKELKEHVSLANRSPSFLSEDECLKLGRWYRGLMESASEWAKPAMRERAKTYYEQFLESHTRKDEAYRDAVAALEALKPSEPARPRVAKRPSGSGGGGAMSAAKGWAWWAGVASSWASGGAARQAMARGGTGSGSEVSATVPADSEADGATSEPPSGSEDAPQASVGDGSDIASEPSGDGWMPLIEKVNPSNLTRQGVWEMDGDALVGKPPGPSQLILPVVPEGDYELRAQFTRTSPIGLIVLHLTVDGKPVLFRMGDRRRRKRDYSMGFGLVDGEPATSNSSTASMGEKGLETGKKYTVRVRVETDDSSRAEINVWINGSMKMGMGVHKSSLDVAKAWKRVPDHALGLGIADSGTFRFHGVHLKMLNGQSKPFGE